jgi:hypothetical protein
MAYGPTDAAFVRAIDWIASNFGPLGDLPDSVVPVVWVSIYRAMEVGLEVERSGGPSGFTADLLRGGNRMERARKGMLTIDFLVKMVPAIRQSESERHRLADSQLLVDILRWDILDAASMSVAERLLLRQVAKSDPLYGQPVPSVLLKGSAQAR